MTTVNVSSIAGALQKRFESDVVSNIQRAAPMLHILGPNVRDADGQNITWSVKFGDAAPAASAAAISEGADVSTFNTDTKEAAVLQYGTYHDAFEVTGKAISVALASGRPEVLAALFESEVTDSAQRLARVLGDEFYNGTGSGERMTGLLGGAILASGTYAGISRGTYTQWRGNVAGNGGIARSLSFSLMRAMSTAVYKASGSRPDAIVCGPSTRDALGALYGEMRRWTDTVMGPGGPIVLRSGFKALEFDGIPVIEDVNCPEGKMLFLSMGKLFFKQLPQPGQYVAQGSTQRPLETQGEQTTGGGPTRLRIRIQPLAILGDKYRFAIYIYPQVQVRQPNAFGVLEDLSY
jgi:hypothetical protein